ncbi:MAG: hypothetical protein QOD00_3426 [Blastocatellia bacterium]|jgi:hypothetical protein|nr:hypothetical protein [Blastocatellia bacterium]
MKKHLFAIALSLILLVSPLLTFNASAHWEFHDQQGQYLFGYTGVESAADYELEVARNHIKTNVTTLSSEWTTSLGPAITQHNSAGNKVAIFLDTILFQSDTPAWYLRPDYRYLFDSWYNRNKLYLTPDRVSFLIINSEAYNARLTNAALDQATAYVKSKIPAIPTVVGYGLSPGGVDISAQSLPVQPDGFAFWDYYILHPEDPNSKFRYWLNYFKSHIDVSRQRLIIVFDAHFAPDHLRFGITQEMLGPMAIRYASIARSEPLVVGMIGFTWQGFGDTLGLRDVTQSVRDDNRTASCSLLPCF